jgi:hypothetical protein
MHPHIFFRPHYLAALNEIDSLPAKKKEIGSPGIVKKKIK